MKKINRPVNKVNTPVLGLDVHEKMTAYTHLDCEGDEVDFGKIASTREAVVALVQAAKGDGAVHVTFEAGGSTWWLFDLLVELLGREYVHVANAKKVCAISNSSEKNDENDAWWLAYLTFEGRLPECHIPTGPLRDLRMATRQRAEAVKMHTRAVVRLRALLRQMGRKLPTVKLETVSGWNYVISLCEELETVLGQALRRALRTIEFHQESVEDWEYTIEELATQVPEVAVLRREIPGIGKQLAPVIVAEIWPIERFASPKALGRFTGMTPRDRSSAGNQRKGQMTREGSAHLRWALTQAAMGCLRSRSGSGLAVGNWIRAKQKRMGAKAKARVAAGRKLSESIWRLFHYGECFDMAKPFGGIPDHANA